MGELTLLPCLSGWGRSESVTYFDLRDYHWLL